MKYIVRRTSVWNDEQPILEAFKAEVHRYDVRVKEIMSSLNKKIKENFLKYNKDIIQLPDGNYRGTRIDPEEVWIIETDNLFDIVDKYGEIVLSPKACEEGYYEIEIYDDYRE